ncbi:sigma 54-interacting transcriptional regulator [bacterium]|nr:sigma 54-interacting transcriptional regulator [bacterium]
MDADRARSTLETFDRATRARLESCPEGERLSTLVELARVLRALGSREAAPMLREALALAEARGDEAAKRRVLVELGGLLTGSGDRLEGRSYLERALEAGAGATDAAASRDVSLALAELAASRAEEGQREGAATDLERARSTLPEHPELEARIELRAGDASAACADHVEARAAYRRAEAALPAVSDPIERAAIELALTDRSERPEAEVFSASELAGFDPNDLVDLLEASLAIARAPARRRHAVAAEAAVALTGAAGGRIRSGRRTLATIGSFAANESLSVSVARESVTLEIAPREGRCFGKREQLLSRAILAYVSVPQEHRAASPQVLALLERVIAAGIDLDELVAVATDFAVEATGAERGLILLREPGVRLGFHAARAAGRDLVDPARIASRSLVREVFLSGHALLLADARSDPEHGKAESVGLRGLRSVLVAPIVDDGDVLGVLYLDDPGHVGRFGTDERELAVGFAALLGGPMRTVLERRRQTTAVERAKLALASRASRPPTRHSWDEIVGRSAAIGDLLLLLDRASDGEEPVILCGERGTGKKLIAQALHRRGRRSGGPYVVLACTAVADALVVGRLHGFKTQPGAFERARGGTLLLQGVDEASPMLQRELARVLEAREVRPAGDPDARRIDVRLVVTTAAEVAPGLRTCLDGIRIVVPPLRERLEDIPELAALLIGRAGEALDPAVLEVLLSNPWHGNVRALRHCLERAAALAGEGPIRPEHVRPEVASATRSPAFPRDEVYVGAVELNERQLALIESLRSQGEVGNAEYSLREGVSQPTGLRDLNELVGKGVLVRRGGGKKTTYRLSPGWESRLGGA